MSQKSQILSNQPSASDPWQHREIMPDTKEKLYQMYKTGSYTMTSLSRMYKVTRQRVHQIIKEQREREASGKI